MNRISFFLLCSLASLALHAQNVNLKEMTEKKRYNYMVKQGKEVIKNFGPGYYREYKKPVISEPEVYKYPGENAPEKKKHDGKEYYTITFPYDKNKETLYWFYAACVQIWAETGEPKGVLFGNGWEKNFHSRTYKDWLKDGVKEEDITPYEQSLY